MKIVAFAIYRQIGPNLDHIFGPSSGTLGPIPKKILMDNLPIMAGYWSKFQPSRSNTVGGVALERYKMAFWTTFLALALGPLVQFQKNFLGTIYQIWRGIGPIFSLLGPKMWEELRWKGIKWHFGPHFWP